MSLLTSNAARPGPVPAHYGPWHLGPLRGFDLETTGLSHQHDRVVTAAIVDHVPGAARVSTNRLANPGVDIPDAAAAVHGITTEHAAAHGRPPYDVLAETAHALAEAFAQRIPVVGMNLVYDFTLFAYELRRHGLPPLAITGPVIDVYVIDKAMAPRRKGSRRLGDLATIYGVDLDQAHDSGSDAAAAIDIALAQAARESRICVEAMLLHSWQIHWRASQMASFAAYRARRGDPLDDPDGAWPIKELDAA